jgi:hypothetical protein
MNEYEKFVPAEIRGMVEVMIEQARFNIEQDGVLEPVALVGTLDSCGLVAGLSRISKDSAARVVRSLAKDKNADFVLWIDEAWLKSIDAPTMAEAKRIREALGDEVKDMPGRIDVVLFSLQTHSGDYLARALREPLDGKPGKYTFGAVNFRKPNQTEGRFLSLLPPRGPMQ